MVVVTADEAPLLPEPSGDERESVVVRAGELLYLDGTALPRLDWQGLIDGREVKRDGELVAVRRARGDEGSFGWRGDLGETVKVPRPAWICPRIAGARNCPSRLRRLRLPEGGILAYDPCGGGGCRMAVIREGKVGSLVIDGLSDVRLAQVGGRTVALATMRWSEGPAHEGANLIVVRLGDRPRKSLTIPIESRDLRKAPTSDRRGSISVVGDEIVFEGEERLLLPVTRTVTFSKKVVERYRLAATPDGVH